MESSSSRCLSSDKGQNDLVSGQNTDLWADVKREGFPEVSDKSQPWKEQHLGPIEQDITKSEGIVGWVKRSVIVAVHELIDLGTGSTW